MNEGLCLMMRILFTAMRRKQKRPCAGQHQELRSWTAQGVHWPPWIRHNSPMLLYFSGAMMHQYALSSCHKNCILPGKSLKWGKGYLPQTNERKANPWAWEEFLPNSLKAHVYN